MALNRELITPRQLYTLWKASKLGVKDYYRQHEAFLHGVGINSMNAWIGLRWRTERDLKSEMTFAPSLVKPPVIHADECIIVGDVHVPTTDVDMMTRMLRVAEAHMQTPRLLIIAGDLFNMDTFSSYDPTAPVPGFGDELNAARAFIDDCLAVFDNVYYFMGNHERRLQKTSRAQISPAMLGDMLSSDKRVTVSQWGYVIVSSGGETYRVTHAKNYSVNQLTVADALAQKHRQHIIQHHEHHLAKGWDRYKHNVIINNGGLFNADAMHYVKLDDSKHAKMETGFTLLRHGVAHLFGRHPFTDWGAWLPDTP